MELPSIILPEQEVIPEKTYDKLWVKEINIYAPDPNHDVSARVLLQPFTVVDGRAELSPKPGRWLEINGLLKRAETDAELAGVVTGLMTYVSRAAAEQHLAVLSTTEPGGSDEAADVIIP